MSNVRSLHEHAMSAFSQRVDDVRGDAWDGPTPCADWNVRALVNHVVGENRWAPPLLAGETVADVGDAFDGDLLGADPAAAWHESVAEAIRATRDVALDRIVHLSFGDVPAEEYLWQLTTDALVHAWDLARATGQPEALPADLVDACARWFDSAEDAYRTAGVIGPAVAADALDPAVRLLGRFGRDASRTATGVSNQEGRGR